jgi:ParB family chromosome partitioning protein
MAKKRIGIDALFQTSVPSAVPARPEAAPPGEAATDRLAPNPHQPRTHFDAAALDELTASIRAHGVLHPIVVLPPGEDGVHEIVAGERRWRAARAAGLERVPVRVLDLDPGARIAVAMVENLQREDLSPLEEAEGYVDLLRARLEGEPGFAPFRADDTRDGVVRLLRALNNRAAGNTKDNVVLSLVPVVTEVFSGIGRITWQTFVAHRLPLLGMPEEVKAAVRGGLPYTKARAIARLTAERVGDDASARRLRLALLERARTEGLSVRALQAEIAGLVGEPSRSASPNRERRAGFAGRIDELRERIETLDPESYGPERRAEISAALDALLKAL